MAEAELVKFKLEDNVAIITISRPESNKVNVLTSQVMKELDQAVDQVEQDENILAAVITGEGPYTFVAGADIKEIAGIDSKEKATELARKGQAVFNKIERLKKPVICAINAVCLGGGMELAMACHFRICAEKAKLGQPEILLGIIPGFGGTQRMPRLVGVSKAMELLLTGDQITGKDAAQIGLVNQAVPDGRVLKEAVGLAKKLSARPQVALRLIRESVQEGIVKPLDAGLELEASLFGKVSETEDMKEGVRAFIEKRQPRFQNR